MIRYLKRLISSKFVRVKAFPMYGGIGVSAPSLHRESTDSLIKIVSMTLFHTTYWDVLIFTRLVLMASTIDHSQLSPGMTSYTPSSLVPWHYWPQGEVSLAGRGSRPGSLSWGNPHTWLSTPVTRGLPWDGRQCSVIPLIIWKPLSHLTCHHDS